ncbi:hypothetical protein AQUCO_02600236v1 [Aquilegia coerulea]|uniref:HTH myb-type domain-containing protein n=1 Tax=Aquilegia coerulea TaxID=218851 RepID=A0A2G5D8U8_AQUCA|nr:hypothetical protein AQUCO_02600236v1 [Aquilegia coerulea]
MVMMMDYMETIKITNNKNKAYQDYMQALLEERRKIQVFHRELPLCLDLVNQAIENCKQYVYSSERSDQCEEKQEETSSEGPVLEEFIPMKRSLSCEEEEEDKSNIDESNVNNNNNIGKKVDWLRSVQLWNQNPEVPPPSQQQEYHQQQEQENSPRKEISADVKENGGAFHPFHKTKPIKTVASETVTINTVPNSVQTASTNPATTRKEEKENQLNRKTRRCWSPELHRRFLQALQQLGGSHAATPKQIRELMKVDGLTNDEVKSHLQKYRLHTRRPGPSMHGNGNTPPTQFVVVGGIWVPPQDYTPSTTNANAPSADSEKIYVPVAATSQLTLSLRQQQQQQKHHKQSELSTGSSHSERKSSLAEHSTREKNARSSSPAVTSSSTETTTASPNF